MVVKAKPKFKVVAWKKVGEGKIQLSSFEGKKGERFAISLQVGDSRYTSYDLPELKALNETLSKFLAV